MPTALIIEDEMVTANRLEKMLLALDDGFEVLAKLPSIEASVNWLRQHDAPSVIFMDIHLADGNSFEIFKQVKLNAPVIFTTAYDQYALQAFKVNGLDYLLKPLEKEALAQSVQRLKTLVAPAVNSDDLIKLLAQVQKKEMVYRSRFLVAFRDSLLPIPVADVAYFISEFKTTHLVTKQAQKHPIEQTLEELETELDPRLFFRASRQLIVANHAIKKITQTFNGKLQLMLEPPYKEEILMSREKSSQLKDWLDK